MQWRRYRTGLAVLAALGALALAGRLLDLAATPPPATPSRAPPPSSTVPVRPAPASTTPPPTFPRALARPLRLPSPRPDGSCPATPPTRDRHLWPSDPQAPAVVLGNGPVYPVLFTNPGGGPDRGSSVYWIAPNPLDGVAIVRGHRLGMPQDLVRFQDEDHHVSAVQVLDPAAAGQADNGSSWWLTFKLRVGIGCYGLQIDGADFSQVIVVNFRS